MRAPKGSASQHQVREGEQGVQLRGVLRQAAIARFTMSEQVFQYMKRMLNFRAHAGLGLLEFLFLRSRHCSYSLSSRVHSGD